ncbi:DNA-binding domain-containing protein [Octadecabacter sp. 1_MG-2023]|uniref:HvfC/BufC N-terminal domain-containing protein n=1 Tax=unclassified Octadecabacter TaxID=196158 RepID=UPI001C0A23ED|nr:MULTISPECIES: DNA-binding domain-containing protein [unclassified Octadecabacter]MBU2992818.1 DNA-binding domain-containing protein [Octadecabacter sp. B2R22]MDO6733731.1 DNA-binding domain-containing protein [Octadecabacter sp. 1_MG-2023]
MITTQTEFRTALLDPTSPPPEGVRNPDGVQATKRFDVYRNNVAVSLTDALGAAFPVVAKLVGDDFFRAMAGVYLRAHPPSSPVMMFYGEEMPEFLAGFGPAQSVPYLPDIARLELALRHSYHASDATPIAADALAQIAPDSLPQVTFTFAPSVYLIPSRYPLQSIWAANTSGGDIAKVAQPALVTRPEFDPMVDALTQEQAAVTQALIGGQPLGQALQNGGAGFDLGPLLGLILSRNALISLKT